MDFSSHIAADMCPASRPLRGDSVKAPAHQNERELPACTPTSHKPSPPLFTTSPAAMATWIWAHGNHGQSERRCGVHLRVFHLLRQSWAYGWTSIMDERGQDVLICRREREREGWQGSNMKIKHSGKDWGCGHGHHHITIYLEKNGFVTSSSLKCGKIIIFQYFWRLKFSKKLMTAGPKV